MWYQIFLYCLATTVLMHGLASLLALRALRKHKLGRYIPIVIAVTGFLYPLTGGIITSKFIIIYCSLGLHCPLRMHMTECSGEAAPSCARKVPSWKGKMLT